MKPSLALQKWSEYCSSTKVWPSFKVKEIHESPLGPEPQASKVLLRHPEVSIVQYCVSGMANWPARCFARLFVLAVITLDVCSIDPDPVRFAAMDAHEGVEDSSADRVPTRPRSVQISSFSSLFCSFTSFCTSFSSFNSIWASGSTCFVARWSL